MKHTGQCPKCKSHDIVSNKNGMHYGHRSAIVISAFASAQLSSYICLNCGLIEEYLSEKVMQNPTKMDKIRMKWGKYLHGNHS